MNRSESAIYRCGSLLYSPRGLIALFAWMLWGDFCFSLMEAVVPSILPIKFHNLGASDMLIGIVMTSAPGVFNVTITPWVSFKSDRHRSRWGRRLPFILSTMPFLTLALIFLAFTDGIGAWIHGHLVNTQLVQAHLLHGQLTQNQVLIGFLSLFGIGFSLFNMFVNTVYWYLFNDVVPQEWMGRFMGWFRMVSIATNALYQFFIFKYAGTHMREIFLGAALLYLVGFGLMCLRVKEGEYPPPVDDGEHAGLIKQIRLFARECFTMRYYWDIFLNAAVGTFGGVINATFGIFFTLSLGLTYDNIGKMNSVSIVVVPVCLIFAGALVDRWHAVRSWIYLGAYDLFLMQFGGWVWLFVASPPPMLFVWVSILVTSIFRSPIRAVGEATGMTVLMRLLPREQFGQFSGAMALVRAVAIIVSGVAAGAYVGFWKHLHPANPDFAYRYNFLWSGCFTAFSFYFAYRVYRTWKRLGGDRDYQAPLAPFRQSDLKPYPGDDGSVCRGLHWVTGLSTLGLVLGNATWIVYYIGWERNPHYVIVFSAALASNIVLHLMYMSFIKFMERP